MRIIILKRQVKSNFTPSVFRVGVLGLEETRDKNGRLLKSYRAWQSMLGRCYSKRIQERKPTYIDCMVCEEWKYYKNFKEWFNKNYYEIGNTEMHLDKDILMKGNKIYSPETCVLVPNNINKMFVKKNANRGELPIGVSYNKKNKKYISQCSVFDIESNKSKNKHLGEHRTSEEAFKMYKKTKEDNIKLVADYYKDRIPEKLYEAMYKYEVHIND